MEKCFTVAKDEVDIFDLRRTILANLDIDYAGFREYWVTR
jgi:uncharacterized ferritin-like protein (DUF455 family)